MRNLSPFRSKDLLTLSPCLHFMVNICQFLRPIPNLTQTRSIISASLLLAFNFPFAISTPKFKWELCKIYIYIYIYIYICMPLTKRETKRAECRPNSNVFMDRDEIVVHKNVKKKEIKLQPS